MLVILFIFSSCKFLVSISDNINGLFFFYKAEYKYWDSHRKWQQIVSNITANTYPFHILQHSDPIPVDTNTLSVLYSLTSPLLEALLSLKLLHNPIKP